MAVFRLDSIAPAVAERFRRAPASGRRYAALLACEHAAATVGLPMEEVDEALAVLRGTTVPTPSLRERLEELSAELDDEYFRSAEESDSTQDPEALRLFSKARATSALAFALSTEDSALHEAIYEAIAALDDPTHVLRIVEQALSPER